MAKWAQIKTPDKDVALKFEHDVGKETFILSHKNAMDFHKFQVRLTFSHFETRRSFSFARR